MVFLFVFFRILRRALWWLPVGLIFGMSHFLRRILWWLPAGLPFVTSHSYEVVVSPIFNPIQEFILGPSRPPTFCEVCLWVAFFYFLGILYYADKYRFLLSQRSFDSRIVKTPYWRNHLMPEIQSEIDAGEFAFPSFAESRAMPPQEFMTRMFMAKKCYADRELRRRLPKLRRSIFKI